MAGKLKILLIHGYMVRALFLLLSTLASGGCSSHVFFVGNDSKVGRCSAAGQELSGRLLAKWLILVRGKLFFTVHSGRFWVEWDLCVCCRVYNSTARAGEGAEA